MAAHEEKCCVCGIVLPNRWAVAKRETTDGGERCYCHLHARETAGAEQPKTKEVTNVTNGNEEEKASDEREIARAATGERVKKAWAECSALAARLGGGVKQLWNKVHPDRSPETMLATLDGNLADNAARRDATKERLDAVYREIVAKKKAYQAAPPVRQRLLKVELQTLLTRYKGLEREFSILCENERSIETVKGRFLEVLAYGRRGKVDADVVDRLVDDVESEVDEAEDVQDALGDLERAGRRKERSSGDFDAELAGFDGEAGLFETESETNQQPKSEQEKQNESHDEIVGADRLDGVGA